MFRKGVFLSVIMVMILGLLACGGPKGDLFPDSKLATAIWEAIGKPEGAIAPSDLEELITLDASGRGITDLTGLEYCINLTKLDLAGEFSANQITDISPLASLTNLTELDLEGNWRISDISPLASLTNLTALSLSGNLISDISPLASLTKLTVLGLGSLNFISDISPLANLTDLTDLSLGGNQISDISPLANLTDLTKLSLYTQTRDIPPLANLTNLNDLYLGGNEIRDISPLANLTDLTVLDLTGNQISDISPVASLTNLTRLDLGGNQISDISPLLSLPSLKTLLILNDNPLSETSLSVYIPQLKKGGVSIPSPKTYLGMGRSEFLLIPAVAFIAALVVVLRFRPTRGGRRRGLLRGRLVVGVILTGLYTLWSTLAMTFDVTYLEPLIFWVWIPGLALYGIIALVMVITKKKG